MNIEHFRRSLKTRWLTYYRENRSWLTRIAVWVNCEGQRRPSSSFILGTLSVLEPQLTQMLPLIVDLSSSPDRVVIALGLNFNPDDELEAMEQLQPSTAHQQFEEPTRMLPGDRTFEINPPITPKQKTALADESCQGAYGGSGTLERS